MTDDAIRRIHKKIYFSNDYYWTLAKLMPYFTFFVRLKWSSFINQDNILAFIFFDKYAVFNKAFNYLTASFSKVSLTVIVRTFLVKFLLTLNSEESDYLTKTLAFWKTDFLALTKSLIKYWVKWKPRCWAVRNLISF